MLPPCLYACIHPFKGLADPGTRKSLCLGIDPCIQVREEHAKESCRSKQLIRLFTFAEHKKLEDLLVQSRVGSERDPVTQLDHGLVCSFLDGEAEHRDMCLNKEQRAASMCVCVSRARGEALLLDL